MNGVVGFDVDSRMEKYLTKMEKEELREIRHGRMSKAERLREWSARVLKVVLVFCVPIVLLLVMLFVLVLIYNVRPFTLAKSFTRTTCEVVGHSVTNETAANCNARTDHFRPCLKISVLYPTASGEKYQTGIIMENEQALANCDGCSYTFGRHGLLHQYQDVCESWKEYFDTTSCVDDFLQNNGVEGTIYPCYFNPDDPQQVIKDLAIDVNSVIHAVSWPVLLCVIYSLSWAFVCYDSKQGKMIDGCIQEEVALQRAMQQAERYSVNEWKRQRLGETLGVRSESGTGNSFVHRPSKDLKRISASLPSLDDLSCNKTAVRQSNITEITDDLDSDDELDLRHLDLAVSQQNINDLSEEYPDTETPLALTYENVTAAFNTQSCSRPGGLSRATLPILPPYPMSTFRQPSKLTARSTTALLNPGSVSFFGMDRYKVDAPFSNRTIFYQQPRRWPDAAVREDEIDDYYFVARKISRRKTNDSIILVDRFSTDDESSV